MHDERPPDDREELTDPIAYRDLTDQLPNEALREELANMTPEEREAYLLRLEELAKTYLGPGGP
ncbi:MAG TPA: hypothetical protein VFP05_00320 [Thermomicrobiales bacterium]|nr:hypothetical protein [Thermomicrobiales bacterium]